MEKSKGFTATSTVSEIDSKPSSSSSSSSSTSRLEVHYTDWRGREGQIIDPSTSTALYDVSHRYRKPTFTLASAASGATIATASSSKLSMKMDMDVHGQHFALTPRHKLGSSCTYLSRAFPGQTLLWEHKCDGGYLTYTLLDEGGMQIARFRGPGQLGLSMKGSFGEFEFVEGRVGVEGQRDEVVATGLTLAYKAVINRSGTMPGVVVVA